MLPWFYLVLLRFCLVVFFFNRTVIVFDDVTEMLPSFFLFLGIYGVGVRGVKGKRAVKRPNEP